MVKEKKGKLKEVHISVADNGYTVRAHHESPDKSKDTYGWEKPKETVHKDGDSLMSKVGDIISEHEGKDVGTKKEPKAERPRGTNMLKREKKEEEDED